MSVDNSPSELPLADRKAPSSNGSLPANLHVTSGARNSPGV
ncbi:hypothetical protein [Gordonia sp. MP11Mi]|uniref:Uncharacterized protein n=1 Tax=Gordonia sp. MP11Mi TaxID=3022769 RepID=A0AA97GXN3_9ACTN